MDVKQTAQQLCDELRLIGTNLSLMSALDIAARLAGYPNWRGYLQAEGSGKGLFNINLVYLHGFADKGYWWTKAEVEPWLVGEQGEDYDGPFTTDELAKNKALQAHPQAAVLPYSAEQQYAQSPQPWETLSVFAKFRVFLTMSPRVTRVAQNPGGEDRRAMEDSFAFEPHYAQRNGRLQAISWRSPLKFQGFDTVRKKAFFDFDARVEFTKPPALDVGALLKGTTLTGRLAEEWGDPDIELVSWQ